MPSLTIRDIPADIMDKIKILSKKERRSLNNEILLIIENGLRYDINPKTITDKPIVSKDTQLEIWKNLAGKWDDNRETEDIIKDIYTKRTKGRDVEL